MPSSSRIARPSRGSASSAKFAYGPIEAREGRRGPLDAQRPFQVMHTAKCASDPKSRTLSPTLFCMHARVGWTGGVLGAVAASSSSSSSSSNRERGVASPSSWTGRAERGRRADGRAQRLLRATDPRARFLQVR